MCWREGRDWCKVLQFPEQKGSQKKSLVELQSNPLAAISHCLRINGKLVPGQEEHLPEYCSEISKNLFFTRVNLWDNLLHSVLPEGYDYGQNLQETLNKIEHAGENVSV